MQIRAGSYGVQALSHAMSHQTAGGRKRRRKHRRRRSTKKRRHPKKRQRSRTRKGRLDFVTHKGDRAYNARSRRQYRKRKPYTRRRRR